MRAVGIAALGVKDTFLEQADGGLGLGAGVTEGVTAAAVALDLPDTNAAEGMLDVLAPLVVIAISAPVEFLVKHNSHPVKQLTRHQVIHRQLKRIVPARLLLAQNRTHRTAHVANTQQEY